MKRPLTLLALCIGVTAGPALAADTCPWAGGSFDFKENGIYGELDVNADCTQLVWKRVDEPQTTALTRTKNGWKGELERVDVELLENGKSLRIYDGGVMRQTSVKPKG